MMMCLFRVLGAGRFTGVVAPGQRQSERVRQAAHTETRAAGGGPSRMPPRVYAPRPEAYSWEDTHRALFMQFWSERRLYSRL